MKEPIGLLFKKYGMRPPKPWVKRRPLYQPKEDCFAFREINEDTYTCGCLDKLYCKYEICKFYKTRSEYYGERDNEKQY